MGDWNISRKRFYGLPLPFYKCHKCKKNVVIGSVKELEAYAVDKQKVKNLPHLHKPYIDDIEIRCPYCGEVIKRVSEVGDCWLDAGITPFSTKKYFTDKDYFDKNFPCDVVIEMKEQIRLWFYSLLFMSVVLEKKAPYKKVIGFAMLVDENGNKFSKSGPNNVSFDELADIYTSDTLRYLFAANNMQNDTRFGVSICEETRRKMLGLWNTYVFFNTYAVLDNPKLDGYVPKNLDITDKWLIDATNTFVSLSKDAYEKNEYFVVTKLFETYIDDVSNFYIRANRRRFWKSGSEEDKLNAYYSLYYAIKNTTLVLAPITPFMSEYIYQNLVREMEKDADSSVIMYGFPNNLIQIDDKDIAEKTELARHIIALGQRLRAENNLKVKQPLKKMYVNTEKSRFDLLMDYKDIILEELNIKELVFEDKAERFNDEFLTVNFSAAGRVLKGEVQNVKDMLVNSSDTDMQKYVQMYKNGSVNIAEFTNLDANLFMLSQKAKKEFVIQRENSVTVVLDITLDEELVLEGIYREIVRSIQVLRKEYDFNIEQRISLDLQSSSQTLCKAIELFKQKIMEETLVKCFGEIQNAKVQKDVQINGETLQVTLGE